MKAVVRTLLVLLLTMSWIMGCGIPNETGTELPISNSRSSEDAAASVIDPADDQAAQREYDRISKEYEMAVARLKQQVAEAKTTEQEYEIFAKLNPVPSYTIKLMQLAREYSQTQTGLQAALEAVSRSQGSDKDQPMTFLLQNFASKLNYRKMIQSFHEDVPSQQIENWMKQMIEFAPAGIRKARAIMGYTKYVDQLPAFSHAFQNNPHLLAKLPREQQRYLLSDRGTALKPEMESLLQSVIDQYPDEEYRQEKTFAEVAKAELYELQHLSIGSVAPDIVGQDLDGIEFKLSDYRGKIVMLDFWGHWCPPCRQMYAREQELVASLGTKPFVLIGVNSDKSLNVARNAVRDEGLPWRHFWNGPKGTQGPISGKWNVDAWPTVYLIDGNGIIRFKEILGKDLDRALESLLAEVDHPIDLSQIH